MWDFGFVSEGRLGDEEDEVGAGPVCGSLLERCERLVVDVAKVDGIVEPPWGLRSLGAGLPRDGPCEGLFSILRDRVTSPCSRGYLIPGLRDAMLY